MLREKLQSNPWIGWCVAIAALCLSGFLMYRNFSGGESPYSPERMREKVTIKFTDTGDTMEMYRGDLDYEIRTRGEGLDKAKGIINPKTGQPTGFPYNPDDWDGMIDRIAKQREAIHGKKDQPAPVAPAAPAPPPSPGT